MRYKKYLVVNADDFGLSPGVNRGIFKAHEDGIVSSASLMVRWPHAVEAANYSRKHPGLGLGLHIDLGEWKCVKGGWQPVYEVVSFDDIHAVADEVTHQLDLFSELTGKIPTHIDSHQHVHKREPTRTILMRLAERLSVPLRHFNPMIRYCGDFYGQTTEGSPLPDAIQVESLVKIVTTLDSKITELACHPGEIDEEIDDLGTAYRIERAEELRTLCDLQVKQALRNAKVKLVSFDAIP